MRSRLVWPAVCSAALLAGCGGHAVLRRTAPQPRISRAVAASLAQRADALASRLDAGDACAASSQATSLRTAALAALPQVPLRLRARLSQAVDALAARVPACPPPPRPQPHPKPEKHPENKHEHGNKHHEH